MVTLAKTEQDWGRANYLELSQGAQPPQAIGSLLSQVLARYSLPNLAVTGEAGSGGQIASPSITKLAVVGSSDR